MHTNIETTIDRFLAEVVEHGIVTDLEPLRTRVISIEKRDATTTPAIEESVNPALNECEEEQLRADDGTLA